MYQNKLFIAPALVWKYCAMACFLLCTMRSDAQRHDNNWIFGYSEANNGVPNGVIMNFNEGYPAFSVEDIGQSYSAYCAICSDSVGNLLFHANSRAIRNRLHQIMENGDTINPGTPWSGGLQWDAYPWGSPISTGGFALPAPGLNNIYYLIHTPGNNILPFGIISPICPELYVSTIDMNANGGLGKVLSKNVLLTVGDLPSPIAIKHGNGRDWWLIAADFQSNKYQTFLIDPAGIHFKFDQVITPDAFVSYTGSQSASPDGRFFVNNDGLNLWIYDFDRCSGVLTNPRMLPAPALDLNMESNAFSKDSRFLYLSSYTVLYQLDMLTIDEPEIAIDTIAHYDYGNASWPPNGSFFFSPQLAPDGKIYYTLGGSAFHVLNRPELPLLASDYSQRGLTTPYNQGYTRYHFPTYTLGRALDAPCDTLPFSGAVEERFRHIPWEGERPVVRDPSEVKVLKLPDTFHLPEPAGGMPQEDLLSPVRRRERAIIDQQQKLKNDVPE